jgi:CBS domain-containing protein
MQVHEVMTRDVMTVGPTTRVDEAVALMVGLRVSGLPVVDAERRVLGMFTEADLLHRAEIETDHTPGQTWLDFLMGPSWSAARYVAAHSRTVADLMTRDVACVTEATSLRAAVDLLENRHIRRIPVVRDGVLVGIVSRLDLVRAVARKIAASAEGLSEQEIAERLRAEVAAQPWRAAANINITVRDHVVILEGVIYDEAVRRALHVAADNVASGLAVADKLELADPYAGLVIAA